MSEVKFTKGPWKVTGTGDVSVDIPAPYYESIGVGVNEHAPFCIVTSRRNIASRLEANANLIAAAPELYEALELILSQTCDNVDGYDEAKYALSKARGEHK